MRDDLYLIDTSVWIDVLPPRRAAASQALTQRVADLISKNRAATTGMIRLELLGGARNDAEYLPLVEALDALLLLPTEERVWDQASLLSHRLRREGRPVPLPDLVIATVAMESGAVLLHRDRHFDIIAAYSSLRVESHLS